MNLFLLAAVPLTAVAAHRWFFPGRPAFADPKAWILGALWSLVALITASFFGGLREFSGNQLAVFAGLLLTDALLAPGLVVAVWILIRPKKDIWELGLWLALVFSMAGIRDFVASTRAFDMNEYFLIPLDRMLLMLSLPALVMLALRSDKLLSKSLFFFAVVSLIVTGPLFQVFSFAGMGWVVWTLLGLGIVLSILLQKKTAFPQESGSSLEV